MPFVAAVPKLRQFIGVSEVAGALVCCFPSLFASRELTVLAARALILVMILALAFHVSRGESRPLVQTSSSVRSHFFISWQVKESSHPLLAHKTARKSDPVSKSDMNSASN